MSRYKCAFSFYGGKSKIAHLYPSPKYPLIVEPFAGGASYSLLHHEGHSVWLNDLDRSVYLIWSFLVSPWAEEHIETWIPDKVVPGTLITNLLPPNTHPGLLPLMQAECNHGTQGARGIHNQVTWMGAKCWPRLKPRLLYWIPRIRNWAISNLPYEQLANVEATWFIDPPYDNDAGRRYRHQVVDYAALAEWCQQRRGQVIVCENEGASWLPFKLLCERRGVKSRYQKSTAKEMYYEQG